MELKEHLSNPDHTERAKTDPGDNIERASIKEHLSKMPEHAERAKTGPVCDNIDNFLSSMRKYDDIFC